VGARAGRAARDHQRQGGDGQAAAARPPRRRDGELSGLVLDILHQAGRPVTAGEVLDRLQGSGAGPLAYTTVVTILSRLHAQGIADRSRAGRAYAYRTAAGHAQLAARQMRRVLDAQDDRAGVLASFVGGLTARDERVLRELLVPDLPPGAVAGDEPGPDR